MGTFRFILVQIRTLFFFFEICALFLSDYEFIDSDLEFIFYLIWNLFFHILVFFFSFFWEKKNKKIKQNIKEIEKFRLGKKKKNRAEGAKFFYPFCIKNSKKKKKKIPSAWSH